ncbi:MAG: hypothetical protein ACLQM6_12330 [Acidobacteriaceae bacterium]
MSGSMRLRSFVLISGGLLCSCFYCAYGQMPEQEYAKAYQTLRAHSGQYDFFHDGTPEAIAATQQMWSAVADFISEQRKHDPNVSVASLNHSLCLLTAEPLPPEAIQETAEQQCEERRGDANEVVDLGQHLLLVSPSVGESGTVFLLGEREGKDAVLWSIASAGPQRLDPDGLIGAWKAERASGTCREKTADKDWVACGPLYANVGKLPPDDKGRTRFYVDAGYEQGMGATIGKQTSIWQWDGNHAELEWIGSYEFMIDQAVGTSFDEDKGTLVIGEKGEFRTMYDCGQCIERPMEQRVLVTKLGVEDLGVRSLAPEMDAIDEFLWRLSHGLPTSSAASTQAAQLLRSQVLEATRESRKIDKTFYSVGMVSDVTRLTKAGAEVCVDSDDLGVLIVQMRRTANGGYFITHIAQPSGEAVECPSPAFYPPPPETTSVNGTPGK